MSRYFGTAAALPTTPPFDNSWVRSGSNPILSASVAWEQTAVAEVAAVWYSGGSWKMWYSGGWANPGLGYATSSDGISWTKYVSNPVLGQGGSSLAGPLASGRVFLDGSTYHCYFSSGSPLRSTMLHYTSTDGLAWTSASLSISFPSGETLWGNREVWKESSTWYMLQEAFHTSIWVTFLYTSPDGNTWTVMNGGISLTTLQVSPVGSYGGPRFATSGTAPVPTFSGTYHLWYHATPGTGTTPTNIYHATSTDKINWTQTSPNPVLTYAGSGFEVDQVAGPVVIVVAGEAYLFYDGDNNATSTAKIGVATASAT